MMMMTFKVAVLAFFMGCMLQRVYTDQPPNIIFILADDLGWNDVSFHGSSQIPTPHIDALAQEGVILTNYYVSPICTPTRSAIMTGKHPIHTGLEHGVIGVSHPYGLGLEEKLMPQYLRELGYRTHMVGKWHLGFFKESLTPSHRGFESFYGYYAGMGDYYTHEITSDGNMTGFDFHMDGSVHKPVFGQYSTEIFTERTQEIILKHNPKEPLYIYLAHQAVHSANYDGQRLQAPHEYYKRFPNITHENRRKYAAMVAALDDSIGNITQSLKESSLYNNTLIVFTTDNGGPANGFDFNYASNWPLRGMKHTTWEGGLRGVGFLWGALIEKPGRMSDGMMHVCDWVPTLYGLAGGNTSTLQHLDGIDVWPMLSRGKQSPRQEILHTIDPLLDLSAIRIGDYKLVQGQRGTGRNGWYPPEGVSLADLDSKPVPNAFVVSCPYKPANASTNCNPYKKPCLFNIRHDPCEFNNIANWNQDIVELLLTRIEEYRATMVPIRNKEPDPRSYPKYHDNCWVPWVDDTSTAPGTRFTKPFFNDK
ncbi:arylsulfatase I isoform X1 [Strongylocentrotus purpuratus]|uniref:Sulfatase N-terminal domain-containing protein n=1 Tax=Strongylocentrotus purpuratus TaxID=7668 RepID=A0A7M7P332_STRPU|nr:arylsulfatase I isoform X1 [Strongylocentrotus purpuratus]